MPATTTWGSIQLYWNDRQHHPIYASYQPLVVGVNPLCFIRTRGFTTRHPKPLLLPLGWKERACKPALSRWCLSLQDPSMILIVFKKVMIFKSLIWTSHGVSFLWASIWSSMGPCRGTSCLGISALVPWAPPPPPSLLTWMSSWLFSTHILLPLLSVFSVLLCINFFPFLNLLSQRCCCCWCRAQPWPVMGLSWSCLALAPFWWKGSFQQLSKEVTPLTSPLPRLCHAKLWIQKETQS